MALARRSLEGLLDDSRIPESVRRLPADDFGEVRRMLDKLESGHLHIAACGRVGVGKSSLLNALLGEPRFSVSPLHGETTTSDMAAWQEERSDHVYLVDTPGINEIGGEARERLANEVADRSDLVLFVADGDLTYTELPVLQRLGDARRPVLLVLNKADQFTAGERGALLERLRERSAGVVAPENVVPVSASPSSRTVVVAAPEGGEREEQRPVPPDVEALRDRLWAILEKEGKTLAAVNAGLFAGRVSTAVGEKVVEARRRVAERVVRTYCIAKGVAVAFNPVPVADLFAAAAIDGGMVVHLSRIYGLPISQREAGSLIAVIVTQMAVLMGTVWAVHLVSSALKLGSAGMSTVVTAGAQGAVAYYGTYVVGQVAERYFAQGKSWGEGGPRAVVEEILESLDRDSVLTQARTDILARLRGTA